MPWAPKPPMTLKEAKKAYKKDNTGFKFTPSQLARADRQDAQEDKRRKALEKQQTREINKRKREDKAERDRAVKRQMLEEGRITVEDTWGKVNASQPRLNKFFAQPPTAIGPASHLRHEVTRKSDDNANNKLSDCLEPEHDSRQETRIVEAKNGTCRVQDTSDSDALLSPRASCQDPESVDVRHSLTPPRPLHKHSSPLQEVRPSQLNAQPKPGVNDFTAAESDHGIEEDFTDGLNDDEFLEFCDKQNDIGEGHDSSATPLSESGDKASPNLSPDDHTMSTIELIPQESRNKEKHTPTALPANDDTQEPPPAVLIESFSAFFNEIDESELIAFAEQVEASMGNSPQVCSLSTKAIEEHSPAVSKQSNFRPAVIESKPPYVKSRKRRMPWDDIDGPGPSTQAAMLELLEQAEAQMQT
ncbi:uncharacterized protein A1O9_00296 [Exophiala aquamarina CBS 119918]|uniref:Uncharacterized protein n=1 Tax=Exophiala aquamarina CBS 119918 TaxID=1182545 RepID=A0A072PQG8_9EURO|nr:uncharacterized protein A1O9_00296 [Exophiala aquamarina CBS 119918]KEF62324.1 hypothetical protein A1O9_00296 [Exophiala aquamarina CBS 119918]